MHLSGTVLFVDLAGSTALFEALGNPCATGEITQLKQQMGDVVPAHGGRVVQKRGDRLLGVFAEAAPAVTAAGALQCQDLTGSAPWPHQQGVGLRVGVASGKLVQIDGDICGDAVNVAARLCERAGTGEIWITDATAADAGVVPGSRWLTLAPRKLLAAPRRPDGDRDALDRAGSDTRVCIGRAAAVARWGRDLYGG